MAQEALSTRIVYFAGPAHEAGPARGLPTLYVAEPRPTDEVRRYASGRRHVVLGARHPENGPYADLAPPMCDVALADFTAVAAALLDDGYWITLEYPVERHNDLARLAADIWMRARFIPQPRLMLSTRGVNPNTVVKLDQTETGGGLWSVVLGDLDRAWCWTSPRAATAHEILARRDDLL